MDCRISRRYLHFPRTDVECEASHQSDFSSHGELCVALRQCLLRQLAIRDVASDPKQPLLARRWHCEQRVPSTATQRSDRLRVTGVLGEAVLGTVAATDASRSSKCSVQDRQIVRMYEGPRLGECFGWRLRVVPVNPPIPRVVFEAAGLCINTPDAQRGTIKSQLQPIVAVFECIVAVFERRLIAPPLGEQRGKTERARRNGQQCGFRGMHAVSKAYARIA